MGCFEISINKFQKHRNFILCFLIPDKFYIAGQELNNYKLEEIAKVILLGISIPVS